MESSNRFRERWVRFRNELRADPSFQRFAARFPLFRPIARRRARTLFDLVAGFTYSQILAAAVETQLLEQLRSGPIRTDEFAENAGLPVDSADRLLRGAAALGLVERLGDKWMLGATGADMIGNPGIAQMVAHHRLLYADLAEPVALLRRSGGGGALSNMWQYAEHPGTGAAGEVEAYSALMAASQPLLADQLIAAYPFARHRRILDVGGGQGAFVAAVQRAVPKVGFGLFDLPDVVDRAATRLNGVTLHPGTFLIDPLPGGYDLITLVRVLHDHDDQPARQILRAARAALEPGGTLLVAEPMAGTRGAEPTGDAYFGFYLLAMGSGRPRSANEICAMLRDSGFRDVREVPTDLPIVTRALAATA